MQAQHPDRGGDPTVFTAGLAEFDRALRDADLRAPAAPPAGQTVRVTVVRRPRGVQGWVRHVVAAVRPRRPARVH